MKKAILDTSFIMTSVKQKIDFFHDLEMMGLRIIIPEEVIQELNGLATSSKSSVRENAKLALRILELHEFEKVSIGNGKVDKEIIKYAKNHEDVLIGTLDKEIKKSSKTGKLVVRGKKKIELA